MIGGQPTDMVAAGVCRSSVQSPNLLERVGSILTGQVAFLDAPRCA